MWKSTSVLLTSALFHRMSGTTDIPIYKFRFNRKFLFFFFFFWVFNSICPGYSCLIMVWVEGRGTHSAPSVNPDRKMLLIWNLAQSYFVILQKKWWKIFFKIAAIWMMTSLIMSIFLKNYAKNAKICFFFLKITLWQLQRRFPWSFFSFWKSR